jgi:hypothetical protein
MPLFFCNPVNEFLQADFFLAKQPLQSVRWRTDRKSKSSASGSGQPHAMRNLPVATSFGTPVTGPSRPDQWRNLLICSAGLRNRPSEMAASMRAVRRRLHNSAGD